MLKRLALTLLLITPSLASAEIPFLYDESLTKDDLKELSVRVEIVDNAKGACWTNLKEVREYAEEKLRTFGVEKSETDIMDTDLQTYWLFVHVAALRTLQNNAGMCLGSVDVSLESWTTINGKDHRSSLGDYHGRPALQAANFNKHALLALEYVFSRFPKK